MATQKKKTIVVADDDEGITAIAQQVLKDCGYDVFTAGDGKKAKLQIPNNRSTPSLLKSSHQ